MKYWNRALVQSVTNSQMHVLIVNSEYPPIGGGAGNASAHIAKALIGLGNEVTVLTSAFADLPNDEIKDDIRIIRLPALRRFQDRSTAFEQILFMLILTIWGFFWLLKLRPNVILAFFGVPSGLAVWLWSLFIKVPFIVLLRGGDVPGFRPYDFAALHRLISPILRLVWKAAHAVVANSNGLKELGLAFEPGISIKVIPNGVSEMASSFKRQWAPAHMLFVGRLVYQKGLDILFDALANLTEQNWQLTIVGDGPRKSWLEQRARDLGIFDRIHFSGWQPREKLARYYQEANLFVYPSRHEGMPNALLEAMSAGLPSVASHISGNEELIDSGKNGILVKSESKAELQAALKKLIQDEALLEKMGHNARKKTLREYSWQTVGEAYNRLLIETRK